jgi:hypothetical protein
VFSRYLLLWCLLALIGIANGVLREATYGRVLSELGAHQVSTLTAMLACTAAVWTANRFWPIASVRQAWVIGGCWLCMTIAFEFGFGHLVAGHSWSRLLADYDLSEGRLWSLFLAWITVLPYVVLRYCQK